MGSDNSGMQPYDQKEYTQEMSYKGSGTNGGLRRSGYVAGTHARIDERARKQELTDIGIATREEYADIESHSPNGPKIIKMQRITRTCAILFVMFILSMICGVIISAFWGGGLWLGLGIGAAVGIVLFLLPAFVYLLILRYKP